MNLHNSLQIGCANSFFQFFTIPNNSSQFFACLVCHSLLGMCLHGNARNPAKIAQCDAMFDPMVRKVYDQGVGREAKRNPANPAAQANPSIPCLQWHGVKTLQSLRTLKKGLTAWQGNGKMGTCQAVLHRLDRLHVAIG